MNSDSQHSPTHLHVPYKHRKYRVNAGVHSPSKALLSSLRASQGLQHTPASRSRATQIQEAFAHSSHPIILHALYFLLALEGIQLGMDKTCLSKDHWFIFLLVHRARSNVLKEKLLDILKRKSEMYAFLLIQIICKDWTVLFLGFIMPCSLNRNWFKGKRIKMLLTFTTHQEKHTPLSFNF